MNVLFQEFLTQALRESLGVSQQTRSDPKSQFPSTTENLVKLRPDLVLVMVSVNSSMTPSTRRLPIIRTQCRPVSNACLCHCALDLPGGLLIYAKGEGDAATYQVLHTDKRLEVAALDLSKPLDDRYSSASMTDCTDRLSCATRLADFVSKRPLERMPASSIGYYSAPLPTARWNVW